MGLRALYESVDEIPESLKEFYAEDNGHFVLTVDDLETHPKVRGLSTANKENVKKRDEWKKKAETAEAKLKELPEGFTVDEYLTLKASATDPNDPDKKKKQEEFLQGQRDLYEKKIKALGEQHAQALAAKDTEIAERDGYIDRTVVVSGLKDALLDIGANPDLLDGALATLRPSVKVKRSDDGSRSAVVETDLGEVTVPEFVKTWAATKGKAYMNPAKGPEAKGSSKPGATGKTMTRADYNKLDPMAQRKAVIEDKVTITD